MTDRGDTAGPPSFDVRRSLRPGGRASPVVDPIWPSAVWGVEDADALDAMYEGRAEGHAYAREGHPNADILAERIDRLEGATGGLVFSSGMGAVTAALFGLLKTGDHVVAGDQLYGRSLRMMTQDLPRFGVEVTLADPTDAGALERAVRPGTRMVLVEVISNPTLRVADMAAAARAARSAGALLAVDATFATPRAWRPFEHGADIVIHSVTKLLAGHSDVTLGWAAARDPEVAEALAAARATFGLNASPFDCWLAERGLNTFPLRYDRAEANAMALADHIALLPGVEQVIHPGRADHPDHARAAEMLKGRWGAMVSFRLAGGREAANRFIRAAEGLPFAPSLGDVQTLLSHPPSSSHRGLSEEARQAIGITQGFIRVSVGIEDIDLLRGIFTRACEAAAG